MKEIVIIISVLILTFGPSFMFRSYLEKSGEEILDVLNSMKDDIDNDLPVDKSKSEKLKGLFSEKEKKWILIVDHEISDEIENSVGDCIAFYNEKEAKDFNASYTRTRNSIEDLSKREEFSVENVL